MAPAAGVDVAPAVEFDRKRGGYPVWVAAEAKRLAEAGASITQIRRCLARRGARPAHATVREWIDPEFCARMRKLRARKAAERTVARNGGAIAPRVNPSPEFVEGRVVALGSRGLTAEQVSSLVALDFGLQLREDQIVLTLHQAGVVPPTKPGGRVKTVAERRCAKCDAPFQYVKGAQGRPPVDCEQCSSRPDRVAVTRLVSTAVANGAAAPTNPTGRPS